MFLSFLHTASAHLRTSVLYLASVAIIVSIVLLFVASLTFEKQPNDINKYAKTQQKDHWIWAIIPFVMMLVMLVPIINESMWK